MNMPTSTKRSLPENIRQAIALMTAVFQRISDKRLDKTESHGFLTAAANDTVTITTTAI
mgnify:CR=1 FL=1